MDRQTNKQTDRQTNMTDYPIDAEGAYNNLRSNDQQQLFIQQPRCESFKKSFRCSGATCWNNLPLEIRNSLSLREFKFRFKQMLFDDNDDNKLTLNAHVCMQFLAFILQTYLSHDILLYFYRMKRFVAFSMYYMCKHFIYIYFMYVDV